MLPSAFTAVSVKPLEFSSLKSTIGNISERLKLYSNDCPIALKLYISGIIIDIIRAKIFLFILQK